MDRRLLVACIISIMIFAMPTAVLASLWSTNQQALWTFSTYGRATSVTVSSDGSYIAIGVLTGYNPSKGQIVLMNKSGAVLWARNSSLISSVAIAADGSRVAASGIVTKVISPSPYVAQQTGIVYYFDHDGNQLWNYSTQLHYVFVPPTWIPPMFRVMLSQDGTRVVVDTGSGALVFDGLGRLLWSYTPSCAGTVCPWLTLASANASFIVSVSDQIHAFNGNGVSLWNSSSIPQPQLVTGVMSKDGRFTLLEWENYWDPNNLQPTLMLLDNSGVSLWNRTLSGVTAVVAMSSDDSAIVTSPGGRIGMIDPQNRVLWNSTQSPGNLMITTSHGSYTAAILGLGLGNNVFRILDSSGRVVWGYGDFGEVDALALSSDDSFLAVATGPYANLSNNSATVVFLPGPKNLTTDRGLTYAWFTIDPNTQDQPWLFVVPALLATVPLLYLLLITRKASQLKNQGIEGQQALSPPTTPS